MKKYIISSAMALLAVSSVSAEEGSKPQMMRAMPVAQIMEENVSTGDPATDAKIKALQKEMEAKIKLIREEYKAKIVAIAAGKKITTKVMMASTTMMRKDGEREGMMRGSTTPPRRDDNMKGSSTVMRGENGMMPGSTTPPRREEGRPPMNPQVQGASTEVSVKGDNGFRSMFNKFFGR